MQMGEEGQQRVQVLRPQGQLGQCRRAGRQSTGSSPGLADCRLGNLG